MLKTYISLGNLYISNLQQKKNFAKNILYSIFNLFLEKQ